MIDIYTHIFPDKFFDVLTKTSPKLGNIGQRLRKVPALFDLDLRFRHMDDAGDGYQQIISLPNPPLEDIADAKDARFLAAAANDAMAEICEKHRDRFPAFAAAVSLHDVPTALEEIDRAIGTLGAKGIQTFRQAARSAGVRADLQEDGRTRPADLDPPGAHRRRHDRLQE
jgi:predicted TIM-barrel fold metal-dependent hydrolase